jgi:hypothetical protein
MRRVELLRFFERSVRASFGDLALHDEPAARYLAEMLARFARTEQLYPRGARLARLESVVDLLLEAESLWNDAARTFQPEREVAVRRHIGDFTLFMTGLFRERVERAASTGYYVSQGKRAYRFVSEHDRASSRPTVRGGGPLYGRLADRFEDFACALDYARRVHFRQPPAHPFFTLRLE